MAGIREQIEVRNGIRSIPHPDGPGRPESLGIPKRMVVVTEFGMLTRFGFTKETLAARYAGESSAVVFQGPTGDKNPRVAAPLREDFKPVEEIKLTDQKTARMLSYSGGVGFTIVMEAMQRARLLGPDGRLDPRLDSERGGIFLYSGSGQQMGYYDIGTKVDNGGRVTAYDPFMTFTDQVNAHIARKIGLTGGKIRYGAAACATSMYAFEDAVLQIQAGELDYVVAGGYETMFDDPKHSEKLFKLFDALRALSKNPDPKTASRPFDEERNGFVLGEGGGVLILESLEHAQRRGVKPLAVVEKVVTSVDANPDKEITAPDQENVARTLRRALRDDFTGRLILPDRYIGHYTSTHLGDESETQALRNTIPDEVIGDTAITAPKSATSHLVGGAGAVATGEGVDGLITGDIAPTIHLQTPDEELTHGLDIVTEKRVGAKPKNVLIASMGFGGQNGAIRLRTWEE